MLSYPMAQITIRNLDDAVVDALRKKAAANGRSMEEEARRALAAAAGAEKSAWLSRAETVRASLASKAPQDASETLVRAMRDARNAE